jgi:hypothetical protein
MKTSYGHVRHFDITTNLNKDVFYTSMDIFFMKTSYGHVRHFDITTNLNKDAWFNIMELYGSAV